MVAITILGTAETRHLYTVGGKRLKISDFTMPEIRYYLAECNFTADEKTVFIELSHGNTTENVAEICNMSVSTTKRIKNRIWTKIERIKSL